MFFKYCKKKICAFILELIFILHINYKINNLFIRINNKYKL